MRKENASIMQEIFSKTIEKAVKKTKMFFSGGGHCGVVDVDNDTAEALHQMAEHYIIVQGFAFAAR